MGNYVEIARTSEFSDGDKKKLIVQGHEIMLARVGENYYAVNNRCPHLGGDLSAGTLEGTIITCPRHKSQFDISNRNVIRWLKGSGIISGVVKAIKSSQPLQTYPVKIHEGIISVEI